MKDRFLNARCSVKGLFIPATAIARNCSCNLTCALISLSLSLSLSLSMQVLNGTILLRKSIQIESLQPSSKTKGPAFG